MSRLHAFILGSGGHARAVHSLAVEAGYVVEFFLDPWATRATLEGVPVLRDAPSTLITASSFPILGVGNNAYRRDIYLDMVRRYSLNFQPLVHPGAHVSASSEIGPGSVVFPGAVIGAGVRMGIGCIANSATVIEHDSDLGQFVSAGPGAILCGGVQVHDAALVGAGATVLPQVVIGHGATLGAMSLALHDVPAGEVHVGVPSRRLSRPRSPYVGDSSERGSTDQSQ
jgi:sugar O-acyltransferase (sialic acid O-acetyltransferase NeuD family)